MYLDMVVHAYPLTVVRLKQETYKFLGQLGLHGELRKKKNKTRYQKTVTNTLKLIFTGLEFFET